MLPPNEPALNVGVGNPIHLVTGNKYQYELDLPASTGAPGLEIARHYNAQDVRPSPLGRGWMLSYDTRLHHVGDNWQIVQSDGSRITFSGSSGQPLPNRHGRLYAQGSNWIWVWPTGKVLTFDQNGWLVKIAGAQRHEIVIKRHNGDNNSLLRGAIAKVRHSSGADLSLQYRVYGTHAYLSRIDSPAGQFVYRYETVPNGNPSAPSDSTRHQRLSSVTRPDGMQRHYLYESGLQAGNPYLVTGIVLVAANGKQRTRINTWAYDKTSRAILSIKGPPASSVGKVSINYVQAPANNSDGLTVVTNSKGGTTRFITAIRGDRYVLLASDGAGCAGCAAPGNKARYNNKGRLVQINDTHITRNATGAIEAIAVDGSGWPSLAMHYQPTGHRRSWYSAATGTETMQYDIGRRPAKRHFSNGDVWHYTYDAQGRPTHVKETSATGTWTTRLGWRGRRLTRIDHPYQQESRQYDSQGRLSQRTITRTVGTQAQAGAKTPIGTAYATGQNGGKQHSHSYTESFAYGPNHKLTRHNLPEGGSLRYVRNGSGQLQRIDWIDKQGTTHLVMARKHYGYRYGNGLDVVLTYKNGQATDLVLADHDKIILTESRSYNERGQLERERHTVSAGILDSNNALGYNDASNRKHGDHDGGSGQEHGRNVDRHLDQTWLYTYDDHSRMVGAHETTIKTETRHPDGHAHNASGNTDTNTTWYAWRKDGSLVARRDNGHTTRPIIQRDPSGLPTLVDGITVAYGPNRRPAKASKSHKTLASYYYNAFGQRIASVGARWRTDYFYLGNKVVAESRRPIPSSATPNATHFQAASVNARHNPARITRRYIYAAHVLVGFIDYGPQGDSTHSPRLYAVHTDMLGTPRMVTDASKAARWLASYSPTGQATQISGDLTLNVRLPGQMFDAATGWHDNLLRTYSPQWGQYLEPDPLGPTPTNQAFGYAGQQPRRYIDPLGLMLFAFDGTRNSAKTQTNVWKIAQLYSDGPVFYQAGPGSPTDIDWDAITAYSAPDILAAQWALFLETLAQPTSVMETIPIDIIGFSRGAALARHFANQINNYVVNGYFSYTDAQQGSISACIDLRFMGLFDTVAQFGLLGAQDANYDLTIAAAWEWVAHAVALHERRWLFPLTSVENGGGNTIESPFIGAHADIGGGIALDEDGRTSSNGDLADVALNWMLWQAHAASVPLSQNSAADSIITVPILHDERTSIVRSAQNGDRRINAPDGTKRLNYQDDDDRLGRKQRQETEALIARIKNWRRADTVEVGTVNMDGYARWLHDELGWQALPV